MNLHDEFNGICDELEAGVVNRKRINVFLRWTMKQPYSLYRRRDGESVEINPVKDAIVVRLSQLVSNDKYDAVESSTLLRKQFTLLDAPVVDDENQQAQDAVEAVRKIVNKILKLKRSTQPKMGEKIASEVDDDLWNTFSSVRRITKTKIDYFTTLVRDCKNHERGVPKWLKG